MSEKFAKLSSIDFNGLLTPLIAIIAVWIAYQQWRTNKNKLKLELYSKRYEFYVAIAKLFGRAMQAGDVTQEELAEYRRDTHEASFLFSEEIVQFIDQAHRQALLLRSGNEQYRDNTMGPHPTNYDHQKVCDQIHAANMWFADNFENTKKMFKKHLDMSKQY